MAVMVVALTLGAVFLVGRQRVALTSSVDTALGLRVQDIAAELEAGSLPGDIAIPSEENAFAQIITGSQVVRSSPNVEGEGPISTHRAGQSTPSTATVENLPIGDGPFRVAALAVRAPDGTRYRVDVGTSAEPISDGVRNLTRSLGAGAPLLVALVGATTWLVVGRTLRPVEAIRSRVERITGEELSQRVPTPPGNDEITRLAATMNDMLERLETALERQRSFVADASHEYRSPLTAIRTQLEVDLAHPEQADWQRSGREILEETIRLQRLTEDLLHLAQVDARVARNREMVLDLDDLVLSELRRLRTVSSRRIDGSGVSAAQVRGDADELRRVIRNLLDNADRHARSSVIVTLSSVDGLVKLRVLDDGPGVAPADRERIFERFARSDDDRARDRGGTGLGLSIARELALAHGGTLIIEESPQGGACFVLTLPDAELAPD
jgi:signal transduction histidine kinase